MYVSERARGIKNKKEKRNVLKIFVCVMITECAFVCRFQVAQLSVPQCDFRVNIVWYTVLHVFITLYSLVLFPLYVRRLIAPFVFNIVTATAVAAAAATFFLQRSAFENFYAFCGLRVSTGKSSY